MNGFQRLFKVKVLAIRGANVKLSFEFDADVPVPRAEAWLLVNDRLKLLAYRVFDSTCYAD